MVNKQKDALESLKLHISIEEFKEIYSDELGYLKNNGITDLKYNQIILTYFLNLKKKDRIKEKIKIKNLKTQYATFIKYIKEFTRKQNDYYANKGYNKKVKLSGKTKINKSFYYFYITILSNEQKELTYSSKKVEDIIRGKFAIFIDKTKNEIIFIGGRKD